MTVTMDLTIHLAEALTVIGATLTCSFFVIRAANRVYNVLRDFPPHRHINGKIIYPEGYDPPRVENLYPDRGASAGA
jgi:hypothetical protein